MTSYFQKIAEWVTFRIIHNRLNETRIISLYCICSAEVGIFKYMWLSKKFIEPCSQKGKKIDKSNISS